MQARTERKESSHEILNHENLTVADLVGTAGNPAFDHLCQQLFGRPMKETTDSSVPIMARQTA